MLDKEKIKQELDEQDVRLILKDLGSNDPKTDKNGDLIFETVCHNSKGGSYKLYYYKDSKLFKCYTGCQDTFDIYELVRRSKLQKNIKIGFYECIKYVASLTNKHFHCSSVLSSIKKDYLIDDWEWIKRYKRIEKPKANIPIINTKILDIFKECYHQSWIDEGISIETMIKYGIKYYIKDDKIVIPHYDIDNNLIGIRGRALREEDILAGKKYMPLIVERKVYNHPLGLNLFGLNHNKEAIKRIKKVIIFESEKAVMQCDTFFNEDCFAVATCGMSISKWQRNMILSLEPKEVFIAYDKQFKEPNTQEAYDFGEKILKQAYSFTPYVTTYIIWDDLGLLPYKASPSDMGKEILLELMKHKYEIKTKNGEDGEICNFN
ncbi:MAG: hypothetical protein ACOYI4_01840 [Christensenellales bacterium]|jgi:hypothetical protein